jgi:hypothetical protein
MIRIIATTISNSIRENPPLCFFLIEVSRAQHPDQPSCLHH